MPSEKSQSSKKRLLIYILLFISLVSIIFAFSIGARILNTLGHRPPPIPRQTDVSLIQDWMTVPFIARSYHVPEAILFAKLEVDSQTNRKSSLSSIASKSNKSSQEIITLIKQQITEFQSKQSESPSP